MFRALLVHFCFGAVPREAGQPHKMLGLQGCHPHLGNNSLSTVCLLTCQHCTQSNLWAGVTADH